MLILNTKFGKRLLLLTTYIFAKKTIKEIAAFLIMLLAVTSAAAIAAC